MSRLLIYTLGFEEKFAIRSFTRHGLDVNDKILLITASPVIDRVKKAYLVLEDFVRKYYQDKVILELFEVDTSNFVNAVYIIKKKFIEELSHPSFDKIVLNLTGGLRVLVLSTFTAFLLLPDKFLKNRNVVIEVEYEDSSKLVNIPNMLSQVLRLSHELSDEKKKLIKILLEKGECLVSDLSEELNLDPSTIRRHLYDLEDKGLISIESERPMKVKICEIARLIL